MKRKIAALILALAACGATVLIHRANDSATVEAVEKLDLNVVCISAEDIEGICRTLELLGTWFGAEDRAREAAGVTGGYLKGMAAITLS